MWTDIKVFIVNKNHKVTFDRFHRHTQQFCDMQMLDVYSGHMWGSGSHHSKSSNSPNKVSIFVLPRALWTSMCCMTSSAMALRGASRRRSFENL